MRNSISADTLLASFHSLPAMDMVLGILLQLRAEGRVRRIVSIINLNAFARARDCWFLGSLVADLSTRVYAIGANTALTRQFEQICCVNGTPFTDLSASSNPQRFLDRIERRARDWHISRELGKWIEPGKTVYLRSHADLGWVSRRLSNQVRCRGGTVLVALEGCYPPHNSLPLSYFQEDVPKLADAFLIYADGYEPQLRQAGFEEFISIGYPKLFPAWIEAVRFAAKERYGARVIASNSLAVFTRGEVPGGGAQIMTNESLRSILSSIRTQVEAVAPQWRITLKPHPAQDRLPLLELAESYANVEVTDEHPSVLACTSDAVVTTWSTSIIDALALRRPVVEYFVPNRVFLSAYPSGSAFKQMGVPSVESGGAFRAVFERIVNQTYEQPDVETLFEHRQDLNAFEAIL